MTGLIVATVVLGAGTLACRAAGPLLRGRVAMTPRVERLTAVATVVMLAALVATAAVYEGGRLAGVARPAGALVGGVLAWRGAPFVVVVVAAAATAATLRAFGVA